VKKIMPLIEEIPNNIVQNEYIKLVAEKINVDEKALIREVNKTKNYKTQAVSEVPRIVTKSSNIYEKAQKNLLSLFLIGESNSDMNFLSQTLKNVKFIDKNLIIILETIDKLSCQINNDVEKLIQSLYTQFAEDNQLKDIITDLIYIADSFKNLSDKDFRLVVQENIARINRYHLESERKELALKYKDLNNNDVQSLQYKMQLREKFKNK